MASTPDAERPVPAAEPAVVRNASAPEAGAQPFASSVLGLQRQVGNRAVARLLRDAPPGAIRSLSRVPLAPIPWPQLAQKAYDDFLALADVKRWTAPDEARLVRMRELRGVMAAGDPSGATLRRLEREIALWPRHLAGLDSYLAIVTGAEPPGSLEEQQRDDAEARQNRFDEEHGAAVKDALVADASGYGSGASCLNYLYNKGLTHLFADEAAEVGAAKERYRTGATVRRKRTPRHAKTLSRLAEELRVGGLVGAVRVLSWRRGHYRPRPTELLERLTSAGPGWYFFLVSVGSFHTFIVAVGVSGGRRRFIKIQDGGSVAKTAKQLDEYMDEYGPISGSSTRIWPVHAGSAAGAREDAGDTGR